MRGGWVDLVTMATLLGHHPPTQQVSGSLCASGTAIRCTSSCCIDDGMTLMEVWRTCRSSPPMAPGPVSRWSMVQPWSSVAMPVTVPHHYLEKVCGIG
ncbi:hypothetical protein JZ751_012789 [Albula glossodonta]|uniref:Uncharacterized protein n=1 Tax=Albula glossodonta TaxID=121402 RepID=A0A8T2MYW1_9TELE|nr:hypothetical protein JZ751_012789 [Albula glossodonta]